MRERPILFNGPMVRALLDGSKTQTRRIAAKPVRHPDLGNLYTPGALVLEHEPQHVIHRACPYGQPGDRLWVREAWAETRLFQSPDAAMVVYREGDNRTDYGGPWKPSIHMRRRDSRILLEITDVRVERLQDISDADSLAEGIDRHDVLTDGDPPTGWHRGTFEKLWERINGADSWAANPWVWAVSFKRVLP